MDRIVDGMVARMKMQFENPTLGNSRLRFDGILFLDVSFHWLNITRGSSYLPLPDWIVKKKAIINPHNNDEECFKMGHHCSIRNRQRPSMRVEP